MNERVTEQIVRNHLGISIKADDCGGVECWEQIPDDERIKKLLIGASKSGPGRGRPEFIISFKERPEFLIVIECKADTKKHQSKYKDKPKDFAVDGVLHYAEYLSRDFNVLAIAVSGSHKRNLRVSHFLRFEGNQKNEKIFGNSLLPLSDYHKAYLDHDQTSEQDFSKLLAFTQKLNKRLSSDPIKLKENHRSILINAILMALKNKSFKKSYKEQSSPALLLNTIKETALDDMKKKNPAVLEVINPSYGFMNTRSSLVKGRTLINLVTEIDEHINPFRKTHKYYDILGQFYVEFLRYSNSDRGLGIVLTPPHITDLATRLVEVNKNDVIYDNCAGTGGFLISGLKRMVESAQENTSEIKRIKKHGIVGVEFDPDIISLLCSNMSIHEDGRSNVIPGDCFDEEIINQVKRVKPTVGFLNPPYKKEENDRYEMEFVQNNLNTLSPGGRCVAILPMQCALARTGEQRALKEFLLINHTLEAVLSLPDQLFHGKAGVVVCLMVFSAHKPHPSSKEVWLGYCKDDGHVIRKLKGRIDYYNRWNEIRDDWVKNFHNRRARLGFSIKKTLTVDDEWCAEAYMKTDYKKLTEADFIQTMKNFAAYKFLSERSNG